MEQHLKDRHVQLERYTSISFDDKRVTFLLYNLSGQIVGFQHYDPSGVKNLNNVEDVSKYYTFTTRVNDIRKTTMLGVWGLETLDYRDDILFIVEGSFDAVRLHNLNLPAIAVHSNNPKHLWNWFSLLNRKIIAVCEDDENGAGKKLAKYGDYAIMLTDGKDLGDMTDQEVEEILHDYL